MKSCVLFLLIVGAALAGDVKLPSGRVLKNVTIGPMVSTQPTFPKTLVFKYETAADFKSQKAVAAEVEEIWKIFRLDADKGGNLCAVIMVVGPATGLPPLISSSEQRNFVFEKKDGAWKMLPPAGDKEEKSSKAPKSAAP